MATAEQIKSLIRSHYNNNIGRFQSIALQIAANEAKVGHHKLAKEIKEIIEKGSPIQQNINRNGLDISAKEELNGILQLKFTSIKKNELVLSKLLSESLDKILNEHRNAAKLREYGLSPKRKLLFHGLPGTGKTVTAAMMATELNLPLYTIMLDGLISKYMGETASKLRLVFNYISQNKAVYLFDEFDAIGSDRAIQNDTGEIKRVLNSFLIFFEEERSESIVIAATNHISRLDKALYRRFDDLIEFDLPKDDEIRKLIKTKLALFKVNISRWNDILDTAKGLSYAEITNACNDTAKEAVLHTKGMISEEFLIKSLANKRMIEKA